MTKSINIFIFLTSVVLYPSYAYSYGSLAIDSNQGSKWGYSYDYDTKRAAEARALKECGEGCRIVKSFESGCGAYAAAQESGGTAYGWGTAPTKKQSQATAMKYCKQYGGTDCIIRVWSCNSSN